jgi:hypothetical protein
MIGYKAVEASKKDKEAIGNGYNQYKNRISINN